MVIAAVVAWAIGRVACGEKTCGSDTVVEPAVALAAARRDESEAAVVAVVMVFRNGIFAACDGRVVRAAVVVRDVIVFGDAVSGVGRDAGEAAPNPSATLAFDVGALLDVGGVV